jgi:hypothetical protein
MELPDKLVQASARILSSLCTLFKGAEPNEDVGQILLR